MRADPVQRLGMLLPSSSRYIRMHSFRKVIPYIFCLQDAVDTSLCRGNHQVKSLALVPQFRVKDLERGSSFCGMTDARNRTYASFTTCPSVS